MGIFRSGLRCCACVVLSAPLALSGCTARPAPWTAPQPTPPRMTAQPAADVPGRRVSRLLDFESPHDAAFIAADVAGVVAIGSATARSGARSLAVASTGRSLEIKLPALLAGRPFPADWTLLGGYLHCDRSLHVTITYEQAERVTIERTVALVPGAWTPVMLDLSSLGGASETVTGEGVGMLRFGFAFPASDAEMSGEGSRIVHLDDLMLIDNHEAIVDTIATFENSTGGPGGPGGAGWSVRRRGLNYIVAATGADSGGYAFALPTAHAQQGGWSIADASPARVRFESRGEPRSMTIYPDGRLYWGAAFQPAAASVADAEALAAQHASPAEVSVPPAMGRVNRAAAGDQDNDGYDESRGAYQVVASGARLEVTLTPRTPALVRPVLEITGLPPGTPRVTMEGRLVPGATRLGNGDLLVELPGRLQRPTLVNVSVK